MARSRNSSPRRAAPAPAPRRQAAPAPAPRQAAPAPAPVQQQQSSGGMMSGLLGTVASGMAFGTGSAIAHRAVGAVANSMSGSSEAPVYEAAPAAAPPAAPAQDFCSNDQKSFFDCLNANRNDISACQYYLDQFDRCKQQTMSI